MKRIFSLNLLALLVFINTFAFAQDNKELYSIGDLTAEEIFETNKISVVSIWYIGPSPFSYYQPQKDTLQLSGSGFILKSDGIIGTNNHVIENLDSILIKTYDGTIHNAEILVTDPDNDVAILKIIDTIENAFPVVHIGNVDDLKAGQSIYAIGSPLGFEFSISSGIIAAIRTNEKVSFMDYNSYSTLEKTFSKVIQITAPISPGNSGGPLFNSKGEVIGITTYSYGFYGNLNFALSISNIKPTLDIALNNTSGTEDSVIAKFKGDLYNRYMRKAQTFKSKVSDGWYYSKARDTMKTYDTLIVTQDSINRINLAKAEDAYMKCLEIMPDSFSVYKELMDLYVTTDNITSTETIYKQVRERFQSDSLINTLSSSLGNAYEGSKNYKKAIEFFEKMLKVDTTDNFLRYKIADTYLSSKDYKTALIKFKELIKRDTTNIKSYIQIGKIYYENYNDYKDAKSYLAKAVENNDDSYLYGSEFIDLYYILGMIAVRENRITEALMYYMDLKEIYSYSPEDKKKKNNLYKEILKFDD